MHNFCYNNFVRITKVLKGVCMHKFNISQDALEYIKRKGGSIVIECFDEEVT